jgi:hypothetical protein
MRTETYEKYFYPRLTGQKVLFYKTKALILQNQNSEGCVRSSDGVDNECIWLRKDSVSCY